MPEDPIFGTRLFVCAKNWVLRHSRSLNAHEGPWAGCSNPIHDVRSMICVFSQTVENNLPLVCANIIMLCKRSLVIVHSGRGFEMDIRNAGDDGDDAINNLLFLSCTLPPT